MQYTKYKFAGVFSRKLIIEHRFQLVASKRFPVDDDRIGAIRSVRMGYKIWSKLLIGMGAPATSVQCMKVMWVDWTRSVTNDMDL